MTTNIKLESEIKSLVESHLERYMINDVFVSFGLDHDGEEAIHVKVNFARGTVKPPASATLDLIGSLTAFLRRSGDRRLVYVRNLFMDGPAADEEHRNTVARRRKS